MAEEIYENNENTQNEVEIFINKKEEEYLKKLSENINYQLEDELKRIKDEKKIDIEYKLSTIFLENFKTNLNVIFKKYKTQYDEKKKYQFGNFNNNFTIDVKKGIMIASDIHSDADSLKRIWYLFDNLKRKGEIEKIIFLGDYGDRGEYWMYTYFLLAAMTDYYIRKNGESDIIFIRGNHEDVKVAERYCGEKVYETLLKNKWILRNIWGKMFLTGIVKLDNKKIFCSHGAIPVDIEGNFSEKDFYGNFFANWNDNDFTNISIEKSPRGAGVLIPVSFTNNFMKKNNIDFSIHGHCHENKWANLSKESALITVVSNDIYYKYGYPFLASVYVIKTYQEKNLLGNFVQISSQKNERLFNKKDKISECFKKNIQKWQNYLECDLKDIIDEKRKL